MSEVASRPTGPRTEILTFLIGDVRGYTSYTQRHGDEAAARLAGAFAEIAREGVEAHGGEVIELRGDEALAVFRSAPAALRAAVDLQVVFADEIALHPEIPLRVGIGIDAGAAVPVEGGYRGGALNLAARLCSKAGPGEVFASEGVVALAGAIDGLSAHEHGEFEMKGMQAPVRVARIAPAGLAPEAIAARFEVEGRSSTERSQVPIGLDTATPIVGRERELHRLRWAWRLARRGEGRAMFVLGPTGIGKTRLLAELAASVAEDGAPIAYLGAREVADSRAILDVDGSDEPRLVVFDDLEVRPDAIDLTQARRRVAGTRTLLVAAGDEAALPRPLLEDLGEAIVRPAPLTLGDVREIASLYLGGSAANLPATLLESSGGVPRRIHRQVSEWAYAEASRRLGAAASRAASGRSDLRSVESEVADTVVDLQMIRERARLYESGLRRSDADPATSPFKGLAAFEPTDADLFYGRERLVADLVARLAGSPLLGVVGPSGSGKSSAVRAGLIPAIRTGVLPGSDAWHVVLARPGEHPLRSVEGALGEVLDAAARASDASRATDPTRSGDGLADLDARLGPDVRILLVVDQFEEVFTACTDEAERAAFLGTLASVANHPASRTTIVLAIRADFYGRCAEDPALAELLASNHVLVGPLTADEYRRAIEQPALRVGVHVEPALTEALVAEVLDEPGALPLLSTALLELWDRREGREIRLDAYVTTGGVRGAVSRLAEEVFAGFTAEQQAIARAVMLRLAGPGEGDAIVRRRVPLAEFDAERNEDVARVVEVLTDRRLLTVSEGVVEVAHEALLREWPRLRTWIEEDRTGRVLHAHLIETARGWAGAERDPSELYRGARLASALDWTTEHTLELNELEREFLTASREATEREADRQRRTNRRLRGLLVGVALFLVVALIAGGLALVQRSRAEDAATVATAQRLGAQAVVEDELDLSLLLARQAYAISDSVETRSTLLASLLKAPGAIRVLSGTGDRALLIRSSADRSTFAVTDNTGGVAIYDAEGLRLRRVATFDDQLWFDVSPDGSVIAGRAEADGPMLGLIDVASGETRTVALPAGDDFAAFTLPVAFRPDGASFVSLECRPCWDAEEPGFWVVDRDPADAEELARRRIDIGFQVDRIELAPGDDLVLYGQTEDGQAVVSIRDAATLEATARVEPRDAFSSALSPDGRTLAVGRSDGSVSLVDVASGEDRPLDGRHNAPVQGVGFSPDGTTLLTTADDRDVFVWNIEEGTLREILHGHAGRVAAAPVFDADGTTAFTVGLDSKVIAWDLTGERRLGRSVRFTEQPVGPESDALMAIASAVSSDGSTAISSLGDGSIVAFEPATGRTRWTADPWTDERIEELRAEDPFPDTVNGWVDQLLVSRDDQSVVVSGENGDVVVFDLATGEETSRWKASRIGWVNGMAFAPDGSLVTANDDGRIVVWDVESHTERDEIRVFDEATDDASYRGAAVRVAVSSDGASIAASIGERDRGSSVAVFDIATGDQRWRVDTDEWNSIPAWSPDGGTVAVGTWQDGRLKVFDAATGRQRFEPAAASAGFVVSVGYTRDGSTIVTSGTDGTVKLWDARTLSQVGATLPHEDNEWIDAHVVDGRRLVTLSTGGLVSTWELDPSRWAQQACAIASRTLTRREWGIFLPGERYAPACVAA